MGVRYQLIYAYNHVDLSTGRAAGTSCWFSGYWNCRGQWVEIWHGREDWSCSRS